APNAFPEDKVPQPPVSAAKESQSGLDKMIFLDLRDINVIDVFKFIAVQGGLNVVTSRNVQGRSTLLLKNVKIKDALDILVISNQLAYEIRNGIIYIMTEDEYSLSHGKTFNDNKRVSIRTLKTAKPSYVLATLQSVQSAIGKVIIDEDAGTVVMIDIPEKLMQMNSILDQVESNIATQVIKLQFAKAEDVAAQLKPQIDGKGVGTVAADVRSNQILISAYPERMEQAIKLVKALDRQTRAVMVETRILQLTLNPKYAWGIDWQKVFRQWDNSSIGSSFPMDATTSALGKYGKIAIGSFGTTEIAAQLKAVKEIEDTKLLANPRVMILDREEAKINIGDRIPYVVTTSTGTGNNVSVSEDIRFIDIGLVLVVTPVINEKGFVTMKIRPEISSQIGELITPTNNVIPKVNTTFVESTVIIQDGNSVVLGGLIRDDQTIKNQGIPYLMDIPVVGHMFKARNESFKKTEIAVIITPHIVSGEEDYLDKPIAIKTRNPTSQSARSMPVDTLSMLGIGAFDAGTKQQENSVASSPAMIDGSSALLQKVPDIKRTQQ
ncbi:MAG: secretin N-terminal domain-containing protein, partial [Candidatus Omnitrophota bacterium]